MKFLKIERPQVFSSSLNAQGKKSELIVAQCKEVGADIQLAGDGCQNYIDRTLFEKEGIKLIFQNFRQPVYPQTNEGFVSNLSVVDYLFCNGGKAW
jgi:hypothetical protein